MPVYGGLDDIPAYGSFEELANLDTELKVPSYVAFDYAGKPKQYFIYAKDATNVAITGFGVIDGNKEIFYGEQTPDYIDGSYYPRIPMLYQKKDALRAPFNTFHCTTIPLPKSSVRQIPLPLERF